MEKEFYEEFEDMQAGIDQKQALVEESKKVDEIEDFNEAVRFVNDLKEKMEKDWIWGVFGRRKVKRRI